MVKRRETTEKQLVDFDVERWLTSTPSAWLLQIDGKRVWLPKSQCEFYEDEGVVTMPDWLAIEKELA